MHLKQLKLAGFKSFVDPEIVYFPSQLVAVVGSNGCGKSNIIDAVRWVMGESSAKNLRGESMVDVIFNGSSSRKPLGQASVELLFDNSLGRLGGAYASYQEIAVKRLVTRAGDSQYFLNGTRCRRRDITDLFLGTGAGVKGYSIIGQDTISRLIVAKPEELRLFLEEAAGVSKYKERRRETLQRIAHTQDNLTRVADITEELNKQLQKLERQAKAAERYNQYKEEERQCKAEILAIKWQDLMQKMQGMHQELSQLNLSLEQLQSQLTSCIQERIYLNEQLQNSTGQSQEKQEAFYQLSTQIARLEEVLQQQARDKKRLEHERQKVVHDLQLLQEQLQQDEDTLEHSQSKVIELKSQLDALELEFTEQESLWHNLKQNNNHKEREWQEAQQCTNALRRDIQVSKVTIQHLQNKKQQAHIQLEKLSSKQADLSLEDLLNEKQILEEKALQLIQTEQESEAQVKQCTDKQDSLRQQLQDIVHQLHQQQDCFHKVNSEQAALLAIQKAAKQRNKAHEPTKPWADKPRLMELVRVEKTWEKALESILGATLCAYVVNDIEELQSNLHQAEALQIVTMSKLACTHQTYPSLASKILGAIPASMYHLDSIYTAKDLEEALSWLPNLQAHESIIIATGVRLGPGWVSFPDIQEQEEMGLLALQQKIQEHAQELPKFQELIENLTTTRDHCQGQLHQLSKALEQAQIHSSASSKAVQVHNVALAKVAQNIHHAKLQMEQLVVEIDNQKINLEEVQYELAESEEQYQNLEKRLQQQECLEAQLVAEKQREQEAYTLARQQLDDCRGLKHQTELAYQSELIKTQQIKERLFREGQRTEELQEHLEQLLLQSTALETPEQTYTEQLEELIAEHSALEVELTASRDAVSQHKLALESVEKKHSFHEVEAKKLQEQIAHTMLQEQALALKANSVEELLAESNLEAEQLLQTMAEDATQIMKEEALLALSKKIQALGAINLAAIEEYTTEKQRKDYLDAQCEDLRQALATLQTAIEQIDKETLLRLENTFDEVNTAFKALFPRLFGGGQAQLELTCDNLLEAGIVVMAQPPGKRNNTIHLLSGGEKAMTAVALVFAIFQLNPSPFCMLDEVDAPLDDTNVGRFCDLVKEMSQFVQFLFITHNKVTMEMADHLIGVTMREPGVSRLVTVDVKQVLYDYGVNHADKLELNS